MLMTHHCGPEDNISHPQLSASVVDGPAPQIGVGVVVPYDMALDREMWRWTPPGGLVVFTRTPYAAIPVTIEMAEHFVQFLSRGGVEVVNLGNHGIYTAAEVGTLGRDQVVEIVRGADRDSAQAILVPDTAMHSLAWLDHLEDAAGKPGLTANQVTVWEGLRIDGGNTSLARTGNALSGLTSCLWPPPTDRSEPAAAPERGQPVRPSNRHTRTWCRQFTHLTMAMARITTASRNPGGRHGIG
jgi:hypothetical protein